MMWREELDLSYAKSLQNAIHVGHFEGAWEGTTAKLVRVFSNIILSCNWTLHLKLGEL